MSANQPAIDVTLIDYLRLATFNAIRFYKLTALIEHTYHDWQPYKWLQYKGRKSACGIFHGIGHQKNKGHFVISVSGQQAHVFYNWFSRQDERIRLAFYCTRIDIQRTQLAPAIDHRPKAYKRLRGAKSFIQSPTGNTLYIGARTSDKYWRIYDKTDTHLRCEVEIKGKMAIRVFQALEAEESLGAIWNRTLLRTRVPSVYVDYFRADSKPATLPDLAEPVDMDVKLDWLSTLDALVYKLANDDDTAERTEALIRSWLEYCTET